MRDAALVVRVALLDFVEAERPRQELDRGRAVLVGEHRCRPLHGIRLTSLVNLLQGDERSRPDICRARRSHTATRGRPVARATRRAGELAVAARTSAPAMSRHLRVLRQSGLVDAEPLDDDARARVTRCARNGCERAALAGHGPGRIARRLQDARRAPPVSVVRTVEVPVDPWTAFRMFTEEIDEWYERGPYSWNDPERAVAIRFEHGRLLEVWDEGDGYEMGCVTAGTRGATRLRVPERASAAGARDRGRDSVRTDRGGHARHARAPRARAPPARGVRALAPACVGAVRGGVSSLRERAEELHVAPDVVEAEPAVQRLRPIVRVGDEEDEVAACAPASSIAWATTAVA